jgi:hypothetical protein
MDQSGPRRTAQARVMPYKVVRRKVAASYLLYLKVDCWIVGQFGASGSWQLFFATSQNFSIDTRHKYHLCEGPGGSTCISLGGTNAVTRADEGTMPLVHECKYLCGVHGFGLGANGGLRQCKPST